jgi:hypothetical protein
MPSCCKERLDKALPRADPEVCLVIWELGTPVDAAAFPECPDKHLGSRAEIRLAPRAVAFRGPAAPVGRAEVPAEVARQEAVAGEEAADSRARP